MVKINNTTEFGVRVQFERDGQQSSVKLAPGNHVLPDNVTVLNADELPGVLITYPEGRRVKKTVTEPQVEPVESKEIDDSESIPLDLPETEKKSPAEDKKLKGRSGSTIELTPRSKK